MRNGEKTSRINGFKGYLLAAIAAAAYGTNPAFAIPLYADGMNPPSVLLFRYIMGLPLLGLLIVGRGQSLKLSMRQLPVVLLLGILMALSSLTLFESYRFINSGVASTLLFIYPVMVALIMIVFFHEKFKLNIAVCLVIMVAGLATMMHQQGDISINMTGVILVMLSALTYALYMVLINVVKSVKTIATTPLLFYLLASGSLVFIVSIATGTGLTVPMHDSGWINLLALALIPTVISLACTTRAIQLIGSTPTAIFGALEPVAAVVLSVVVLGQTLTERDIIGGALIIVATTIVVADNAVDTILLRLRRMFPRRKK